MTILSAQTIRELVLVEPFVERSIVNGKSYGLSSAGYDIRIGNWTIIYSKEFVLTFSLEQFIMPNSVLGVVHDKSSWARQGLTVQNTIIEPGWCGYLTLELTNHCDNDIVIEYGDPIAQVVFHFLDKPTEQPYAGKYQNQEAGPQLAREDKDG